MLEDRIRFQEIKQEIGSAKTQPLAAADTLINHLNFAV